MIGKHLAHYQIVAKIGEGGMGEVFRARDTRLDRDVALKILPRELSASPERAARFEREARTLASLQHPHIASIYGYEQAEDTRFLVMELIEGEDLAQRLRRGPMSIEEVIRVARQIALGMEAAHERNIVHRDLKPANVRIDPDGVVKILDFGLARAVASDPPEGLDLQNSPTITAAMTQMGVILGTAAYMSPEQARGKSIDKRSDIWSFGVMLHEMLTGAPMYTGETVTDILGAIVHTTPDLKSLPPETPSGLRQLLGRCLTPDVSDRLRDIGEARYALSHLDESAAAPPAQFARSRPGRGWRITSLILGLALIAVAASWVTQQPEKPVLQASLTLPPDHALITTGGRGGTMRFSPDGGSIAFVAQLGGQRQIWVRALGEREARPLQGTDGGHRPFWSPDGRSLGFFVDGSVRRVTVSGGAPLTITTASDGRGAAWLPDGTIVFAPTPSSAIFAVSATGGQPRQLTDPGTYTHREPRSLGRDGSFLFVENRGGGQWMICVGYLDGRPHREVVLTGGGAEYTDGRLLFLQGTTLVAQPFDPDSVQLTGEAKPLAEDIVRDTDYGIGVFSASSSGGLVYQAGRGSGSQLQFFDRTGSRLEPVGERGEFSGGALSRDGKTIAVLMDRVSGASDIWLVDVQRGTRSRFTFTPDDIRKRRTEPTWSPDGRRIVYALDYEGSTTLWSKRTDGTGDEEPLLEIPGRRLWPYDVSADGQWVLFGNEGEDSNEDLWVVPVSGEGEPRAVLETPFDEWPGAFSPDGRWLAIDSDEAGRREIYVIPFPARPGKWQISRDGGRFPVWNHDGTELFFQDPEGGLLVASVDGSGEVFVAGEPRELFQTMTVSGSSEFGVSADGQRFLMLEQTLQEAPISLFLNWRDALAGH